MKMTTIIVLSDPTQQSTKQKKFQKREREREKESKEIKQNLCCNTLNLKAFLDSALASVVEIWFHPVTQK